MNHFIYIKRLSVIIIGLLLCSINTNANDDAYIAGQVYCGKNYYGKEMHKIFKALVSGKIKKADEMITNINQKFFKDRKTGTGLDKFVSVAELLYPAFDLALAYRANMGPNDIKDKSIVTRDSWRAYALYMQLYNNSRFNITTLDNYLGQEDIQKSFSDIKAWIEKSLVDSVRVIGTEQEYDRLINSLKFSSYTENMKKEREEIAFINLSKTNDVCQHQNYIDKYKNQNTVHLAIMTHRRDSLAFVQLEDNAAACYKYLSSYPKSEYAKQVDNLAAKYEVRDMDHTVAECDRFLKRFPTSELRGIVMANRRDYLYRDVVKLNTIEGYENFLTQYSSGKYVEEVTSQLNKAIERKYLNSDTSLKQLFEFCKTNGNKYPKINTYLKNLIYMPTSTTLIGVYIYANEVKEIGNNEINYTFYDTGLLKTQNIEEDTYYYDYDFDLEHGYKLSSKTNEKGISINYTTKYDIKGRIQSITGSNGVKYSYTYDDSDNLHSIITSKGKNVEKTDYYFADDYNVHIDSSTRQGGIKIIYECNGNNDIVSIAKMKGSVTLESTTYEYEYSLKGFWTKRTQYNNGNYVTTKVRNTDGTTSAYVTTNTTQPNIESNYLDTNEISDILETKPSFPGGQNALSEFVASNMKYPVVAEENGVQGRVIVLFWVEQDGSITDVQVVKSVEPSLDKEAVRIVKLMPKWIPGRRDGRPVRVQLTLSLTFRLQ